MFVCVGPPDDLLAAVEAVVATCRADADPSDGVRWVARDKWHVTLQFLGDVASPDPVIAALDAVELPTVVEASLGPAVELLGAAGGVGAGAGARRVGLCRAGSRRSSG